MLGYIWSRALPVDVKEVQQLQARGVDLFAADYLRSDRGGGGQNRKVLGNLGHRQWGDTSPYTSFLTLLRALRDLSHGRCPGEYLRA